MLKMIDIFQSENESDEEELRVILRFFEAFTKSKGFKLNTSMLLKSEKKNIETILLKVEDIVKEKEKVCSLKQLFKIK